ncbi:NTP transferase domain-containing protein [Candidatus Woesebacteria bacterium]|nr:NTP transferase domain-containing protein [Candidatus Woesebacteria bacterium]
MTPQKIDTIVILSGGSSSRFKPLSHKNLFLFNGIPLIEYQLKFYGKYTDNLIVVVSEDTKSMIDPFAKAQKAKVVVQEGNGMSAAVLSAASHIKGSLLVVNGNDLYHEHLLSEIFKKQEEADIDGLFVSVMVKDYVPGGYLVLGDSNVKGILEKPGPDNLPSPFFKLVVDYVKNSSEFLTFMKVAASDADDVYEVALTSYLKSGKVFKNVVYKSDWATLKYPWHILDAMSFFLKETKPHIGKNVVIDATAKIIGDVYIDDNVKIYEYSKIVGPCYIGKDTIIGNYVLVNQSMIGQKSVIGGYTELTRSYLGDNVWTHRAYIGDSIVEGDANFAAGSITANYRFDKKAITCRVKGEKVVTHRNKLGVIAGRNIQLGANAVTMPGVMLSDGASVHPGQICSRDI